jgi:hypothetical protein
MEYQGVDQDYGACNEEQYHKACREVFEGNSAESRVAHSVGAVCRLRAILGCNILIIIVRKICCSIGMLTLLTRGVNDGMQCGSHFGFVCPS